MAFLPRDHRLIIFFFLSTIVFETHGLKINCKFVIQFGDYKCEKAVISNKSDENVTELFGTHKRGYSGVNVQNLDLESHNLTFFPTNIEKEFPMLEYIFLSYNLITCVTNAHLRPHQLLQGLYLASNQIEVIESNLFDGLPNLQVVSLIYNNIKHVNDNVKLPAKCGFYVGNNPCVDKYYSSTVEIIDLSGDLQDKCPPLTTKPFLEPFRCSLNERAQEPNVEIEEKQANLTNELMKQELSDFKNILELNITEIKHEDGNIETKVVNLTTIAGNREQP